MSRTRSKAQSQEDANATPVNSTDAHSGIGVINVGGMMTLAVVGIVALVIVAATAFVLAQNSSSPQAVASVAQQVQPAQQVAPQVPSSAQAQAKPPTTVQQVQPAQQAAPQAPSNAQAQAKPPTTVQQSTGDAGAQGRQAPDFAVPTLEGGTFTLSEQRGKPIVLFIMAYWCATCVPEAQALAELHQKYGDQVTIIALDVDPSSTPERLQKFREWVGEPDYVWAFDQGQRVAQAYRVRSLDTTIIINQAGQIVYSDAYPTRYETLEEQIRKLLG